LFVIFECDNVVWTISCSFRKRFVRKRPAHRTYRPDPVRGFTVVHGRGEAAYQLQGSPPKPRDKVQGKGKCQQSQSEPANRDMLYLGIMGQWYLPEQVQGQYPENGNPYGQEQLPFQPVQLQYQVSVGEELKGQGQFQKAQKDLYGIQPPSGFRKGVQPPGKKRKKHKGQCKCQREAEHANYGRHSPFARCLDQ